MRFYNVLASIIIAATTMQTIKGENMKLFDFTTANNVENWSEISDTVRTVGMSKAVLSLQKTQVFQRGIFFTLLNPQPNGAGFAGVRMHTTWNLSDYRNIEIKCRGQGNNENYKIVLRHKGQSSNDDVEYEHFFTAPMSNTDFSTVTLPLSNFKPYFRGRIVPDAEPLDTKNITMFGLQVYGGVYMEIKQKGVSALEIETITATHTTQTLFDFTRTDQVGNWTECSDTIKTTGMSKAVLVIQKTQLVQRAIFFTLFNPRPNKSGFAAIRCDTNFDLSDYNCISIKCRGQGMNFKYKMLLRHKGLDKNGLIFGQVFTAPDNEFATIKLPLIEFKPYYRGQELPQEDNPLDTAAITNLGLKVDMSPYLPDNQAGVAALEIDWIKATK